MAAEGSAGDVSEFEAESTTHLDALYGLALRLTRSATEAEDLVQEAYLRAFRFRDHYTPGTNLRAWMFKILTNLFINRYRRSVKESSLLDGTDGDAIAEAALSRQSVRLLRDPESLFEAPLFNEQVSRALESLPADFRTVVLLSDVEEFSYKEIAEIVGCPIGTVMSRLHRARRSLQKQLVDYALDAGALPARAACTEPTDLSEYRTRRGAGSS